MGRRKIEIKAIKDDRNRSVTFLKRKGGLFKKAHELSVLCSVDVAVIIFGHNKKLYEYSSGDIHETIGRFQYYGGAHEHKGPADFAGKGGGDDDDDEVEDGEAGGVPGPGGSQSPPQPGHPMMPQHMQNHPGFQNARQRTPSASPPIHNSAMPQFQRAHTPQPGNMSRPLSRAAHIRQTSSNLAPSQHQQHAPGPPPQASYAYTPNPPFYNPQQTAQMQQRPPPPPQGHHQAPYPPPYPPQPMTNQQIQQAYMQNEQRRSSMPPAFPPQQHQAPQAQMQRNPSQDHLQPPQQQHHPRQGPPRATPSPQPSPQPPHHAHFQSPQMPQPRPLPSHAKNHSIFTPIDDSRSLLAQHWGGSGAKEPPSDPQIKVEPPGPRSQSIDVAAMQRQKVNGVSPRPPSTGEVLRPGVERTQSASSMPTVPNPPTRSNTMQSEAKRPRLKVQIPSEAESGEDTGLSSPKDNSTSHPSGSTSQPLPNHPDRVVLPPPSPSAGALLSAGAQGPPNPFARPAPPMSTNPHAMNRDANHIETPISALPSRFMNDNLLPSPSTFYPEWGFGRSADNNMLPSPLNFQTPIVPNGGGWRTDDEKDRDRKRLGEGGEEGDAKRPRI